MTGLVGFHKCNVESWNILFHTTCRELKPAHKFDYSAFAKNQSSFGERRTSGKGVRPGCSQQPRSGSSQPPRIREQTRHTDCPVHAVPRANFTHATDGRPALPTTVVEPKPGGRRVRVEEERPSTVPAWRCGLEVPVRFARTIRLVPTGVGGVVSRRTPVRLPSSDPGPVRGAVGPRSI